MATDNRQEFRVEFIGAKLSPEQAESIENAIKSAVATVLAEIDLADRYEEVERLRTEKIGTPHLHGLVMQNVEF